MTEKKINIKDKIAEGGILARVIFEIFGKPKEHVEKSIVLLIEQIRSLNSIKVIVEKNFEPKKNEEMWASFVELEILTKDLSALIDLVVDYLPASVEIIDPEHVNLKASDMAGILNDLSLKLLNISNEYQKSTVESSLLGKKLNTLISVNIIRSISKKELSLKELSNDLRIEEEDLKPFLEDLKKNGKVEEKDDKYKYKDG